MRALKRIITIGIAALAAMAVGGLAASGVAASTGQSWLDSDQFELTQFDTETTAGEAGARTDYRNRFEHKHDLIPGLPRPYPYGRGKKYELDLPIGLVGNPHAVPTCTRARFFLSGQSCPAISRVGKASVEAVGVAAGLENGQIFNLVPGPDEPALFGINWEGQVYAFIEIEVSPDGELTAVIDENPSANPLVWSDAVMWGVPADKNPGNPGSWDRLPFMSNPTNCVEPFETELRSESFEDEFSRRSFAEPARTDCDAVPFAASMSVAPTSQEAGGPTGLAVDIQVPQSQDPDGLATAHVKDVTMTLPEGMTVSASSATGLDSCSPQQFGYHQKTPIACPESSKIGTVEVETPLLDEPLVGPVYVAKQNDNPFNSLLALYMAPAGSGVELKLAGKVDLDPNTGRLTSTFLNNPQQPFSELRVRLKDGPRAPLALPRACGTYATAAQITSWSGKTVALSSPFTVGANCGKEGGFDPAVQAGTADNAAGAFSPFTLRITRSEAASQNIGHFEAALPEGLVAKLAGVPVCPEAEAAAGNCPEASKVGHTTVGVGAGPQPVFAPYPGRSPTALYLGGPYKGGPYSIIAKVPAQAGPFDLGTVILRNALRVDPRTAQVTAIADPLPQLLQGIPISYRDIRVDVDRPGFTVNPTDCSPMATNARIFTPSGAAADRSDGFQATKCGALRFKPRLALRLKGGTKRDDNPALTAVMNARPGDANIERVSVALPRSEFLDQDHIRTVCTRVQFAAEQCPPGSIYGSVEATTPLLDEPLRGPVYLRSSNNPLPDLVAHLRGAIDIELVGRIDSVRGGIRTTFDVVPDAAVRRFVMRMRGGNKSLLVNSRDICKRTYRATVRMNAQNGRRQTSKPALVNPACGKKKAKKSAAKHRKR